MPRYLHQSRIDEEDPRRNWNWRFCRAEELCGRVTARNLYPTDDDFVITYAGMLQQLKNAGEDVRKIHCLKHKYKGAYDAHDYFSRAGSMGLHLMEAFILSGSGDKEIGNLFAMSPEGVLWYEKMFSDIRSRLQHTMFVVDYILHRPEDGVLTNDVADKIALLNQNSLYGLNQQGSILKICAYYGGPIVLELLYTGMLKGSMPQGQKAALAYVTKSLSTLLKSRGIMAVKMLEINKYNIADFVETACKVVSEEGATGDMNVVSAVSELVGSLKINNKNPSEGVKELNRKGLLLSQSTKYMADQMFTGSMEPRASEFNEIGMGSISGSYFTRLNAYNNSLVGTQQ